MDVDHLLKWSRGEQAPPRRLFWVMTERCNLHCAMCGIGSRTTQETATELSADQMLRVVGEIAALGVKEAYLVGGEIFVLGDVLERIVRSLKAHDIVCEATTNGTLLTPKMIRCLVDIGWDALGVSLDGPEASIHDPLRGRPGVFDAAVAAIRSIEEVKASQGSELPRVRLNVILHPGNVERIDDLFDLAAELGVDSVYFQPMTPQTDAASDGMIPPEEVGGALQALRRAAAREVGFAHNLTQLGTRGLLEEAADLGQVLSGDVSCLDPGFFRAGCLVFWDQLVLLQDGTVSPCWRHRPSDVVNVRDASLDEIWYGEGMQRARAAMAAGQFPAECSGCCMPVAVENREQRIAGLHDLGEHDQVVRFGGRIQIETNPFGHASGYLIGSLLALEDFEEIQRLWDDREFLEQTARHGRRRLGALYDEDRPEDAERLLRTLLGAADAQQLDALTLMLFEPYRVGRYDLVLELAGELLAAHPGQAYCRWIRGAVLGKQGDLDAALLDLSACLEAPAADRAAFTDAIHDSLAEVHLARGEPRRAAEHARRALDLAPDKAESLATLRRAERALADLD
jgi:MoaA/NifB/PqqE/SkfB family radical SAM enzyme